MKKLLLGLIVIGGIVAGIILSTVEEEEKTKETGKDSGMNREETENFMREIGYVQ